MVGLEATLIKHTNFNEFDWNGWPHPHELERFFLAPKGQEWSFAGRNDSWGLKVEGLCGTDGRPGFEQVTADLTMIGNLAHGVFLAYARWDGRIQQQRSYVAKGDLNRLGEFVRSLHGTPLSVGLFIPFRAAWPAVKEFIETDGELPTSIEWIASSDLPPETFPDP